MAGVSPALLALLLSAGPASVPWGHELLERARREGKPILIEAWSGTCSSCRARATALDQPAVLAAAGRYLVVHVDRDERPDVADAYGQALALLASEGFDADAGPPLVVALTAEGRPFWGTLARGDSAFPGELAARLARLADDYRDHRAELEAKAGAVTASLREAQRGEPASGGLALGVVSRAFGGLREAAGRDGDFGDPPEILPHAAIRFLLAEHARSGSHEALGLAARALGSIRRREPAGLGDLALLLRALVDADAASGLATFEHDAARLAGRLLAAEDPAGGFRLSSASGEQRVLTGWSGLAIGALARSGSSSSRARDLEVARRSAERLLARLGPPAGAPRLIGAASAGIPALLEDYAYLAEGLLDLHDATGDERWRLHAAALVDAAVARFADAERGGFYSTDAAHEPLPARIRDGYEGPLPSPNGVMALVLERLAVATGEKRYADQARRTVEAFLGDLQRAPRGMETLAAAAGLLLGPQAAPAQLPPEAPHPTRVALGAVTVEASLSSAAVRPGELVEAHLRLEIARGSLVPAHDPLDRDLAGLAVSVPTGWIAPQPARYSASTAVRGGITREVAAVYLEQAEVVVPLRVGAQAPAGAQAVRLRVRFQPCSEKRCRPPESVTLDVPVTVEAR
jgi:uncharacterized protein YyaL (SSP411 family)